MNSQTPQNTLDYNCNRYTGTGFGGKGGDGGHEWEEKDVNRKSKREAEETAKRARCRSIENGINSRNTMTPTTTPNSETDRG